MVKGTPPHGVVVSTLFRTPQGPCCNLCLGKPFHKFIMIFFGSSVQFHARYKNVTTISSCVLSNS